MAKRRMTKAGVRKVLESLVPKGDRLLRMRFGIGMGYCPSRVNEETAKQFSATRKRIREVEKRALKNLKRPEKSRKLRSFLDD